MNLKTPDLQGILEIAALIIFILMFQTKSQILKLTKMLFPTILLLQHTTTVKNNIIIPNLLKLGISDSSINIHYY